MRGSAVLQGAFLALTLWLGAAEAKDFTSDSLPPSSGQCPGDHVVWLNTRSRIYHFAGQTWFGHTINGKYLCEKIALAEGDRPSRNGQ